MNAAIRQAKISAVEARFSATTHPIFLGHRGTRIYAPENTFEAFDIALKHGCTGLEFDVRLTQDGVAVICHDPDYGKMQVSGSTFAELNDLKAILTLCDVLQKYGQSAFLNIELKVEGAERNTVSLLRKYPAVKGLVVSSFLPKVIEVMELERGNLPVPLGYICRSADKLDRWKLLPVTHVMLHHKLITAEIVEEMKQAGKSVFAWTVNDAEEIVRVTSIGVDGVISDDPKLSGIIGRAAAAGN